MWKGLLHNRAERKDIVPGCKKEGGYNMLLSEEILQTTIRIETIRSDGGATGTGFFFGFFEDNVTGDFIPTIVTNKHVIRNAIIGKLRFSVRDEHCNRIEGEFYELVVDNFEKRWIMHPDPNVDLCILPIASIHKEIEKTKKNLHYSTLLMAHIPSDRELEEELSKIEDITIIGYPDGIWDAYNNRPIVRKGITATALQSDFNNEPKFLVDAAIYGGSSGSPVFIFNQGMYAIPNGTLRQGDRIRLVGIIYAVAQHTVNGDIEFKDVPVAKKPVAVTQIPNNLGVAIHARKLKDFEPVLQELLKTIS